MFLNLEVLKIFTSQKVHLDPPLYGTELIEPLSYQLPTVWMLMLTNNYISFNSE